MMSQHKTRGNLKTKNIEPFCADWGLCVPSHSYSFLTQITMAVSAMLLTPSLAGKSGGAIYLEDRHMFSFPSIYICIILLIFAVAEELVGQHSAHQNLL